MDPKGLSELFTKFGEVKDVFIENKRRKMTNTKFGFVRFDCSVAAKVAIQKDNGLWIDGKALEVKDAEYGMDRAEKKNPLQDQSGRSNLPGVDGWKGKSSSGKQRTYAEMVKGKEPYEGRSISIKANEIGNGWAL
ncbi:cold-inducible RNA-binding protein-like [Camellia sinensis]|uniref:cold-inducible RNA-binding protein-like n=1 Tax=Camellia sinensis TaxID=4442 RepID=UPI0010368360|nr:cold-inducible RNA-binding protein-like [Camellia sinensis]